MITFMAAYIVYIFLNIFVNVILTRGLGDRNTVSLCFRSQIIPDSLFTILFE